MKYLTSRQCYSHQEKGTNARKKKFLHPSMVILAIFFYPGVTKFCDFVAELFLVTLTAVALPQVGEKAEQSRSEPLHVYLHYT